MSKNYNEISEIESYLRGDMNEANRRAFDAQLTTDEAFRSEVAAYRQIYTGFEALKEEAFAKDVAQWTTEARAKGTSQLEGDDKLRPISTGAKVRPIWRRLAVAASIALLLGVGATWWGSGQYSDAAIAERGYVAPLQSGTLGEETRLEEIEELFEKAHTFFQNGQYSTAGEAFDAFILILEGSPFLFDELTQDFYLDNAKWTTLLAKFAAGEIKEPTMKKELEKIAADPTSEYSVKAERMLEDMGSFWRMF